MKKTLIAIALVASTSAHADFLGDLFGAPEGSVWNQTRQACQQAHPGRNVDAMERAIRCTAASPAAANFTAFEHSLLKYDLQLVKQIKAGQLEYADFQPYEAAWMAEYRQNLNEQRRLANAVENIPLQQAQWAVTLQGINQAASGSYQPTLMVRGRPYYR